MYIVQSHSINSDCFKNIIYTINCIYCIHYEHIQWRILSYIKDGTLFKIDLKTHIIVI